MNCLKINKNCKGCEFHDETYPECKILALIRGMLAQAQDKLITYATLEEIISAAGKKK
jgi:hypothetical protein